MLRILRFASLLLLAPLGAVCLAQPTTGSQVVNIMPLINRNSTANPPSAASNLTAHDNGIQYHGGPVINNAQGVNVYLIWYGNWSGDPLAQSIVTDFVSNLGGSPYFNINTTYYDYGAGGADPVRNRVNYAGSITDSYSYGTALTDNDVYNIVLDPVASGKLPLDQNGVYFVLTSPDVDETSGLCTFYCAWHGYAYYQAAPGRTQLRSPSSVNLIMAFVGGTGTRCPNACSAQAPLTSNDTLTPNDDVNGDTMVNSIAHELSESVTDPLGTSWVNYQKSQKYIENGDVCSFTFDPHFPAPNGSYYNLKLGNRLYLSQRIWVNALGGYCSMSWINGAN
jgi:Phosphate-induced protein 1 conserved region